MTNFTYTQSESELHCQQSTSIIINPFKCSYRGPSRGETLQAVTSALQSNQGLIRPINSNRSSDLYRPTTQWRSASLQVKPCKLNKQASKAPGTQRYAKWGREMRCPSAPDTKTAPNPPHATPGTHARNRANARTHRVAVGRRGAATSALLLVPLERRPRHRRRRHPCRTRTCACACAAATTSDRPRPRYGNRCIGSGAAAVGAAAAAAADLARLGGAAVRVWVLCGGFCRRRQRRRREEGVVVRRGEGEEKESDADGSAVNAMAAMALSVFPLPLSLSLSSSSRSSCTGWPLWSLSGGGGVGLGPCSLRFLSPLS